MLDLDELKENFGDFSLSDFIQEKPAVFAAICGGIFLFLAALVILLIQTSPEKKVEYSNPEHLEADAPILIPDAPQIEKDYFPSRVTENQWSKEEVDKWFTYPDETVMEDLEKTNNKIVKDILEAAP
ncbi:MAG: hypothetical protein KBT11_05365 [Treponema sp.]|nr:hypothetical protein [Candidatus Treponema equifaecale]